MGTHCSSELNRGHISKSKTTKMKLLLLTALAAVAMAEPEAEAGYYGYHPGYYGYPYGYYGAGFGYGHALPGHSYAHVHRALGKRSAEADAEPGYLGYYGYPAYGYYGYPYFLGHPALKDGAAGVHPNGGTSSVARSPQGLGK